MHLKNSVGKVIVLYACTFFIQGPYLSHCRSQQ